MSLRCCVILTFAICAWNPLATSAAEGEYVPVYPRDLRVDVDVAYLPAERRQRADIYFPPARKTNSLLPAVLVMHGGGFNDGDKARRREIEFCSVLARHGYVCMSINYKLWHKGATEPTWPQSLHDAKTAVRWLRKNADTLRIDPNRIAAMGGSAGGNLAAMLALTALDDGLDPPGPYEEFSCRVQCGIDFYGAVDLLKYHDMKMFLATRDEAPDRYRAASPITYAGNGDAPMLIVHGTKDTTVPLSQSKTLAERLEQTGSTCKLVIVHDAPHTFGLHVNGEDLAPLVNDFLREHLGTP
jgi:acetyl esterase/lipase